MTKFIATSFLILLSVGCTDDGPTACPDGYFMDAAGTCIATGGGGGGSGGGGTDGTSGGGGGGNSATSSGTSNMGSGSSTIIVFNDTFSEICELYISACSDTSWGPDLLGTQTLPDGWDYTLAGLDAGCYDIGALGCNGGEWEALGNNINGLYELTLQ